MKFNYHVEIKLKLTGKNYFSYRTVLFHTNTELSDNNSYLRIADAVRKTPSIIEPRPTPNMGLDSEYCAMKITSVSLLNVNAGNSEYGSNLDYVEEVTWMDLSL